MTARFAVLELVAREALRLGRPRVRRGCGARELWLLADGDAIDDIDAPSLRAALLAYTSVRAKRPRSGRARRRPGGGGLRSTISSRPARGPSVTSRTGPSRSGCARRGLLSRETRTKVGDRANGLLDEWLRVGRRRFAEWSHDAAWTTAFLAGAGSAALLLDEPAALTAFADSKIAARLERAFEDLDLNAAQAHDRWATTARGGGGGGRAAWTGLDSGGYGDGGDGGGGGGGD